MGRTGTRRLTSAPMCGTESGPQFFTNLSPSSGSNTSISPHEDSLHRGRSSARTHASLSSAQHKLGVGDREIEFFAQTQQLISWTDPSLRNAATSLIAALQARAIFRRGHERPRIALRLLRTRSS